MKLAERQKKKYEKKNNIKRRDLKKEIVAD